MYYEMGHELWCNGETHFNKVPFAFQGLRAPLLRMHFFSLNTHYVL